MVTTSLLSQELEPLKAQIGQVQQKLAALKKELGEADKEAQAFAVDRQRFEALRDVCNAIDRLGELQAANLFWEGLPANTDTVEHLGRLRERIAQFEGEIQGVLDRQKGLKGKIQQCLDQFDILDEEIRQAHAREERRQDELVIVREASPVPYRPLVMPWNNTGESEKRYRLALLIALILSLCFSGIISIWKLPEPDPMAPVVIPERLAMLVKKEQEKPKEPPKPIKKEKKEEKKPEETAKETPKEQKVQATPAERVAARTKVQNTGIMAFKSSFEDLMEETPVARLGVEANLNNSSQAAGAAQASRSLVAMQAGSGSGSGGISNAAVSTNLGNGTGGGGNGIGRAGAGFSRVKSDIAGLATKEAKALSSGAGPARTDEEIQILFDRYKAALYRIYNKELRKDPTLRGKMVLRITIEPSGVVSACKVDSTNIHSDELAAQVVERVMKINFGAKEGVPKTTILYPIDFLPAG